MLQKLALALLALSLQYTATAQMSYGVKAGFVYSTLGETPAVYEYSGKNGFQVGLVASFPLTKDFFLQPALLYTQKGYVEKNGSSAPVFSSRFDRRINYLELPLDLVLHLSSTTSRSFSVGAGLVPAIGVSDVFTYELNTSGQPQDVGKTHAGFGGNHYYERTALGLNFLGSAQFKKLVFTADYNLGLTSVTQYSYLIPRLLNRTLAISVTYLLWQKRQSMHRD